VKSNFSLRKLSSDIHKEIKLKITFVYKRIFKIDQISVSINNGKLSIKAGKGFQKRHNSTICMLAEALPDLNAMKKLEFKIYTDDFPINIKRNTFYYCVDSTDKLRNCIPDFSFHKWDEAGINNYQNTCNDLLANSTKPALVDKLFWAGNINVHKSRELFFNTFKDDNDFEIHFIDPSSKNYLSTRFSLLDHLNYKYLIDIEGRGYSGRLKYLLHSGRVLFIQERKWKQYYEFEIIPFVHFIPIKNDFSDLKNQLDWLKKNPSKYQEIATNAINFSKEKLNYTSVCKVFANKILEL
jgi:hypothetical protein